jgi:membrane protein YqaA with SNARE-associated domain
MTLRSLAAAFRAKASHRVLTEDRSPVGACSRERQNLPDVPVEGKPITPYHRRVPSFISMLRHLGGAGVFILAALDSSVLPTLGAVDTLTIVLAARHPDLWPYYAMCSTAGSVCGASVAYRLSGLGVLHRRIKGAVFDRVTAFLKRFGSLALSLAALLPPPFPTSAFVLSAGATRYRFMAFVLSFGTGRACRFALLAYLASVFGRRFVARAWSAHTLVLLAALGSVLVCIGLLAWLVFRKSEPHTPFGL